MTKSRLDEIRDHHQAAGLKGRALAEATAKQAEAELDGKTREARKHSNWR